MKNLQLCDIGELLQIRFFMMEPIAAVKAVLDLPTLNREVEKKNLQKLNLLSNKYHVVLSDLASLYQFIVDESKIIQDLFKEKWVKEKVEKDKNLQQSYLLFLSLMNNYSDHLICPPFDDNCFSFPNKILDILRKQISLIDEILWNKLFKLSYHDMPILLTIIANIMLPIGQNNLFYCRLSVELAHFLRQKDNNAIVQ